MIQEDFHSKPSRKEPIAIVGIGCRFPGGADSASTFWNLLAEGVDATTDVPPGRWNVKKFYDEDPGKHGKMYVKRGGFLREPIDEFDAGFFGISPREAATLDPQQRLLLEVSWEALEDAGIDPEKIRGSDTGVFIGGFMLDNMVAQLNMHSRESIGTHTPVSFTTTMLSNRLSYFFDFRGPSLSIDTACSSSLVALHVGCQALWNGESGLALVGGVNVMHRPEIPIAMCKGQFLSPDGRSKSFDASANGYGRGEGAGIIVLKPLSRAKIDGDLIYSVIRGTGVNQDGNTNGITVPNPESQQQLIRNVCKQAEIDPKDIFYFEAHGTGTAVGDPIEAQALGSVLGKDRDQDKRCVLGSVKSNIGHLEAASGVAGVIKASLILKHQQIPPIANLVTPNPNIPFDELGLQLADKLQPVKIKNGSKYIGINSFGYGGTNAHALIEPAIETRITPRRKQENNCIGQSQTYFLPVSARNERALKSLCNKYVQQFADGKNHNDRSPEVNDLCYSAAMRRTHLEHRVMVYGDSSRDLIDQFARYAQGEEGRYVSGSVKSELSKAPNPGPVFVFTGMGPQWWAMGQELYRNEPVYRAMVEKCDDIFQRLSGWSILEEMLKSEEDSRITGTEYAQPANLLLQIGLAELWQSKGIYPEAIVGHSVGEVSAAYVAGVLSLEDTIKVSYHRSRIQKKAAGLGSMLATGLSKQDAEKIMAPFKGRVSIAAINSPTAVTLAGEQEVLETIAALLEQQEIFNRMLQVEVAYHSHFMDPLKEELMECLSELAPEKPSIPLYSTVTGNQVTGLAFDAQYWCENIRQPVFFSDAVDSILSDGYTLLLELGPHPVLSAYIKECATAGKKEITLISSLNRKTPELNTFNNAVCTFYTSGFDMDWSVLNNGSGKYIQLPTYAWQREKCWEEPPLSNADRLLCGDHELLGLSLQEPTPNWESRLNRQLLPYLDDHKVEDLVVLPGAAYVELGLAIQQWLNGDEPCVLEDMSFSNALVVDSKCDMQMRTRYDESTQRYQVFSRATVGSDKWDLHATGQLSQLKPERPGILDIEAIKASLPDYHSSEFHYNDMTTRGLQYGPYFQGVKSIWNSRDGKSVLANIDVEQLEELENTCRLHPALLDACFQALLSCLPAMDKNVYVPVHISRIAFFGNPGQRVWCYANNVKTTGNTISGDLVITDEQGQCIAALSGIKAQSLSQENSVLDKINNCIYQFDWEESSDTALSHPGNWIVFHDGSPLSDMLIKQLEKRDAGQLLQVRMGECFEQENGNRFRINSENQDDYTRLFESVDVAEYRGIAYLWGIARSKNGNPYDIDNIGKLINIIRAHSRLPVETAPRMFIVTQGAQPVSEYTDQINLSHAPYIGMVRVAILENEGFKYSCIDLEGYSNTNSTSIRLLAEELCCEIPEEEVAFRNGKRFVNRLKRNSVTELMSEYSQSRLFERSVNDGVKLVVDTASGSRNSSEWQKTASKLPQTGEVSLSVRAINLTQKMNASGLAVTEESRRGYLAYCEIKAVGAEVRNFQNGDKVLCVINELASTCNVAATDCIPVREQEGISEEKLLSLFVPYITALQSTSVMRQLAGGERVLVDVDNRQLRAAIVDVCCSAGAHVFRLRHQDSDDKVTEIDGLQQVNHLDPARIFFAGSEKHCFDLIITGSSGELAEKTAGLIAPMGRFVQLGDVNLNLSRLPANASAVKLDINDLLSKPRRLPGSMIDAAVTHIESRNKGIANVEVVKASEIANLSETSSAQCQLLKFSDGDIVNCAATIDSEIVSTTGSHLITGGFGGFGLTLAKWLVSKGVKNLVLVSRKGNATDETRQAVKELESQGVRVLPAAVDISDSRAVEKLLRYGCAGMPALKGIWHTAGVLDDAPLEYLSKERFETVLNPKAMGAWNLHKHSSDLDLEHFVLFSSIASLIGSPGQSNYVAANTFLDGLAQTRVRQGLPATSINWGALGQVGMAARSQEVDEYFDRVGIKALSPQEAMYAIETCFPAKPAQIAFAHMDWAKWGDFYPAWRDSERYQLIAEKQATESSAANSTLMQELQQAENKQQVILREMTSQLSVILKLNENDIDSNKTLTNMGVDSLIAMEIQTALQNVFFIKLSTLELMKGNTLVQLAAVIESKLQLDLDGAALSPATQPEGDVASEIIDVMSDGDVARLLNNIEELNEGEINELIEKMALKGEVA